MCTFDCTARGDERNEIDESRLRTQRQLKRNRAIALRNDKDLKALFVHRRRRRRRRRRCRIAAQNESRLARRRHALTKQRRRARAVHVAHRRPVELLTAATRHVIAAFGAHDGKLAARTDARVGAQPRFVNLVCSESQFMQLRNP